MKWKKKTEWGKQIKDYVDNHWIDICKDAQCMYYCYSPHNHTHKLKDNSKNSHNSKCCDKDCEWVCQLLGGFGGFRISDFYLCVFCNKLYEESYNLPLFKDKEN